MNNQLKLDFDLNEIKEKYKENCLYNWCIKYDRKDIIEDWNDNDYSFFRITYASNKAINWKCHICGNEWKDTPSHRTKSNRGCFICNKKKNSIKLSTVKKINDSVLIKYPDVAKEWSNNNERGPETYYPSSNKKVLFVCGKCGKEWSAVISKRCIRGQGCPYCTNYTISPGVNDLFSTNPEMKKIWDFEKNVIDPTTVSSGSKKHVFWKCERGHEWSAVIYSVAKDKCGCPKCSAERRTSLPEKAIFYYINKYFNDAIENFHPDFLNGKEVDIFIPSKNIGIEYDGSNWHKDTNKDFLKDQLCFDNDVKLLRIREEKCPKYASNCMFIYTTKYNKNLEYLNNAIVELLEYLNVGSYKIDLKNDFNEILNSYLTYEKKSSIINDERIMKTWDYEANKNINPEFVSLHSNIPFNWKCDVCGYKWKVSVTHRARGHNCQACSGQVVIKGKNDLLSQYPEIAKEWDYENNGKRPDEVFAHSNKKAKWICSKCGTKWETGIDTRTRYNSGCQECKKKAISEKLSKATVEDSLGNKFPELIKEWDFDNNSVSPYEIYPNANIKINWKCTKCNNSWSAFIYSRTKNESRCPYCSGRFAIKGVNDLATEHPELLKDWDYDKNTIDPTLEKSGSSKTVYWKCSNCGHSWKTKINVRTRGCGCPKCGHDKSASASKKQIVCVETKQIYDSVSEASKALNISRNSISNCLTGRSNTAGGYKWKYKN